MDYDDRIQAKHVMVVLQVRNTQGFYNEVYANTQGF
jgi:hypothetical protein